MEDLKNNKNIKETLQQKTTFLDILLDIFELTISSSTLDVIKAQIQKNLNEQLKDCENIPFLSIKDPSVFIDNNDNETFEDSILKDLKYLLIHSKEEFALQTDRNKVIYLLCKVLKSLILLDSNLIEQKVLNNIYIIITSAIFGGRSKHQYTLISFLFQLCDFYPEQTLEILNKIFSSEIEKEKKEEINKASFTINFSLNALKKVFTVKKNQKLIDETNKYINLLSTSNENNKESIIEQCVKFYESEKNIPKQMTTSYFFISINNDCHKMMILLLRHYVQFSDKLIQLYYYQPVEERYLEIINILKQKSFRENVYNIFSSKIIKDYYCIDESNKESIGEKNNTKQPLNVVTKQIIDAYSAFCEKLGKEEFRNAFFDKQICVMRLEPSIKGFTNRYLQIAINYSGIDKTDDKKCVIDIDKPSEDDIQLLNIIKEKAIIYDDREELMFIQVIIFI